MRRRRTAVSRGGAGTLIAPRSGPSGVGSPGDPLAADLEHRGGVHLGKRGSWSAPAGPTPPRRTRWPRPLPCRRRTPPGSRTGRPAGAAWVGWRYWLMVSSSTLASWRSRMVRMTSSGCSPMPRMRLTWSASPRAATRARSSSSSVFSYRNPGRIRLNSRGTVSMLWASTSGAASVTLRSDSGLPRKSGISTSTPHPGQLTDLADRLGEQPRPAVLQVVAGDPGDDGELQPHPGHGVGHAAGLVGVVLLRLAGPDLAERAGPGTSHRR